MLFNYCALIDVTCGSPPSIGNGFSSSTGTIFTDTTTFSCDSGYTLSGLAIITCQTNGTWETPPVCSRELIVSMCRYRTVIETSPSNMPKSIRNVTLNSESCFWF